MSESSNETIKKAFKEACYVTVGCAFVAAPIVGSLALGFGVTKAAEMFGVSADFSTCAEAITVGVTTVPLISASLVFGNKVMASSYFM